MAARPRTGTAELARAVQGGPRLGLFAAGNGDPEAD